MKYKIIVDSSANLTKDFILSPEIGFDVAPLTVKIGDRDFVDNENVNPQEELDYLKNSKANASTSCPSPYEYSSRMIDAEYYIIITISGKLSGSYNSAMIAKQTSSNPDNVLVVDSKLVAGAMELDVLKAQELIEKGLDFKTVSEELLKFRDSSNLLFMIDRYDNLIRAGRVNKVMAFIASHLHIKPLCYGENGEVKVKEKIRTVEGTLKRLVVNIGKMCADTVNRICVISHTNNQKAVNYLTDAISKEYHFKKIVVRENRGLCSYYSLEGAVMVGF